MHRINLQQKWGAHYVRYLVSYMAVLLIPLVILTIFYSSRFMKKFYEEIYETVDLELLQISTQLDHELESMQNIVGQINLTDTFHEATEAESPLDLRPVTAGLSALISANPFIENIVLIPNGREYVITNTTTCRKDYYFNRIFNIPGMDTEEFQNRLQHSRTAFYLTPGQMLDTGTGSYRTDMTIFSCPLFTDYQKHEGAVLFYVKNSSLSGLVGQKLLNYQTRIYILDQNNDVVAALGHNDGMLKTPADALNCIDQEDYVVRRHTSAVNQWTYLAFIPDRQTTFSQVTSIMKEFLLAVIIIFLLASITIYFLQKVNYAPVKRLRDRAKQISPDTTSANELDIINGALEYLSTRNHSLTAQLAGACAAVKNERLHRLLNGAYDSREDFNLDCWELELYLPDDYFTVVIIMVHTPFGNLNELAKEIQKQFYAPDIIYYYLHNFYQNQIVLLVNHPECPPDFSGLFENVQNCLSNTYGLLTTIGSGTCVASTARIAQSYMEAVSALDYRFVKGNGTFIDFREVLGPVHATVMYPHQEFEALKNALLSHNEQTIREIIKTIISFMEQRQLPLYLARSICFDLIHLVNEHCRGQQKTAVNSPLELSGIETAREIIKMMQNWSENLSGFAAAARKRPALKQVIQYLNDNCLRCDFSAYETAAHFEMTLPAFSKFFKEHTGQNVMEYTIQYRITRAKELLKTSSLPLKEISVAVGYYNISSFTRRFKINQGMTPGEYRRQRYPDHSYNTDDCEGKSRPVM